MMAFIWFRLWTSAFFFFFFTYNNKLKSGLCVEPSFQCAIKAKKKATNAKTFAQIYDAAYAMP